jgi:hypothetical protein
MYLFAAVVLCVLVYSIYSNENRISLPRESEFRSICNQFVRESGYVFDNSLYDDKDVSVQMANFTDYFIAYSKTKYADFGIFYVLSWNGTVYMKDRIDEITNVKVVRPNSEDVFSFQGSDSVKSDGINKVVAYIKGQEYEFAISGDNDMKIIFISDNRGEKNVFVYGE